jgi:hypothetical protein
MESTPFPASVDLSDCALPEPRKPRKPLTVEQQARRRVQLGEARRRKEEMHAAADAAGKPIPRALAKGESRIEFHLSQEERDAYYALLRQPATTLKVAFQWIKDRGFPIGIDSVRRHRSNFLKSRAEQREAVELAFVFAETARSRGSACMVDAAAAFVEQKVMTSLMRGVQEQPEGEAFDAKHWQEIYKVVGSMTRARSSIEKIRLNEAKAASAEQSAGSASSTGAAGSASPATKSRGKAEEDDGSRSFRDGTFWKDVSPEEEAISQPDLDWKSRPDGHPMENWPREWQEKWFEEAEQIMGRPMKFLMPKRHRPPGAVPAGPLTPKRKMTVQEVCVESADRMTRLLGLPMPGEEAREWCRQYDAAKPERDKMIAELEEQLLGKKTMEIGEGR